MRYLLVGLILLVLVVVVAVEVVLRRCIRPLMDLWKEVRMEVDLYALIFCTVIELLDL